MKAKYGSILILLAILVAVAVAGCTTTTTSPSAPGATTNQPGATTPPAASTPATTGATTIFDMGKVHWFEYNMVAGSSAGTMTSDMRIDYNTAAFGGVSNAKHEKVQMTMGTGDQAMTTVSDVYMDPSTAGKVLGGHTKASMGSTVLYDKDIAANDPAYSGYDYSGQSTTATPVLVGTESVTVPKGTFTAQKYTITSSSGGSSGVVTYWIAAGVPVPVKMTVADSAGTVASTMELVGWG